LRIEASRYILRANVRKRFEPLEGREGSSEYHEGIARFAFEQETVTVRPPFGIAHEAEYPFVHVAPLLAAMAEDHVVGVLLVRLGGYAVGVFEGEGLIASKVGHRLVHGRHRAGGSSAKRFSRRRDEQAKALIEEAAATAVRVLSPHLADIEFVAFGGDRFALAKTLAARRELAALEQKALPRFFSVPEPRKRVLERVIGDVYSAQVSTGQRSGSIPPDG
jgi:VLRF1 release factor-like protein